MTDMSLTVIVSNLFEGQLPQKDRTTPEASPTKT
jgi:hypothetical protein